MLILGIETSCDETAAALVRDGRDICSSVVASQIASHRLYGGVVPEVASRLHIESVAGVAREALAQAGAAFADIDAVAVTYAPGLIGALLAGLSFAKGLSYALQKPLVAVHHLKGHICSLYITNKELAPPFVALVASGGHSHFVRVDSYTEYTLLGRALDDAAGEAFDKVARVLGLPYPGGPEISRLAKSGDPKRYTLPDPHTERAFDVSFSGLKTAVVNLVNQAEMKGEKIDAASLAASFERRAVEILATRLVAAAKQENLPAALCGGVANNSALQQRTQELCEKAGIELFLPVPELTGDNAAMIASAGYYELLAGRVAPLNQNAYATRSIEG